MKTLVKRLVMVILILGVAGAAYGFLGRNGKSKKDEITYETGKVARGDVRSFVTATGTIQPWKIVDIKSNVAGRIDKLYVDIGDPVRAGQKIMDIDPTDTRTAFAQANADLQAAEARRRQAVENLEQQKAQIAARIASSRRAIESARARLAEAEVNKNVQPKLTVAQINQARANLVSAQKAVAQAQRGKEQLQRSLDNLRQVTIPFNLESANSNFTQARANLNSMQSEYQRQRELLGQGYLSKSEVEQTYARLEQMKSSLRTAEQRKSTILRENELAEQELQARIQEAQASIEANEARVEQAQAQLVVANENKSQDKVREHEVEAARAAVAQAQAELASAEAERRQIAVRSQEILAAKSQIVRGEAARDQAKTNLGYTQITAPRGGIIITKQVEEGTVVPSSRGSIGSTNALLQIGDTSRLWIVCNVDETDIGQVSDGQKVTVRVDAYPSLLIDGKVIRIDPQAKIEQNVTLIPVTVEIDTPDPRFKPGMNATCEFIVDEVTGALTVPNEALKETEGAFKVQKLLNGAPADVDVEVGLAGQDVTEIREGDLKEGDDVVTKVIEPEAPETNNPFGNPFGRRDRNRNNNRGGAGGGGAGGGGARGGGGGGR